ncbi:MAG TPA: hypothetical protein VF423_16840 [Actinomycetes bacterium]
MFSAADLDDQMNWAGGHYELTLEFSRRDGPQLQRALDSIWHHAGIAGCLATPSSHPTEHRPAPRTVEALDTAGHLHGVVTLPGEHQVVASVAVHLRGGVDELHFGLPMGSLGRVYLDAGGFPFGADGDASSAVWRQPLEDWMAGIGRAVFATLPFELGLVGFEVSGETDAAEVRGTSPPQGRDFGYLLPVGGELVHLPTTEWDMKSGPL